MVVTQRHKLLYFMVVAVALWGLPACSDASKPAKQPPPENASAPSQPESLSGHAAQPPVSSEKVKPMSAQQIVARILQKDWDMVEVPGVIPPEAAPEIIKLLDNEDPEIRELTIYSLNASGGEAAKDGFLKALNDENDMVRSAACKALLYNYDAKHLKTYLMHLKSNEDEFVREHVALVIGKIGGPQAVEAIKTQLAVEKDADAKHAMAIALARMKDEQGTKDFEGRLQANDPAERVKALEDYLYIRDRSLLPEVAKLLSDTRDAKNMAPAGHNYFIRVCDVAVNTLDLVLAHPFPFPIDALKRYSAEELYQAEKIVTQK
jgi:hypothetical protein